jgi:hypothetical protein
VQTIQFIQTTPHELQRQINEGKIQLQEFLQHFKPIQPIAYLSHQKILKCLRLIVLTIGARPHQPIRPFHVYFLRSEVKTSLKPLNV